MNILRHEVLCILTGYQGEWFVAERTAGEGAGPDFEVKGPEDLVELLFHRIALDEQMICRDGARSKAGITGQDQAFLLQGKADDLVVACGVVIEDVEPQEPHALRELSEHDIGDKFHDITTKTPRHEERTIELFYSFRS